MESLLLFHDKLDVTAWWYGRGIGCKVRTGVNSRRQMEFSWEISNWTPTRKGFWLGNVEWTRLSDLEGELVGNYEWGASDGVFLVNFQLDPDSDMWKEFWSEIPDGILAWSGGGRTLGRSGGGTRQFLSWPWQHPWWMSPPAPEGRRERHLNATVQWFWWCCKGCGPARYSCLSLSKVGGIRSHVGITPGIGSQDWRHGGKGGRQRWCW